MLRRQPFTAVAVFALALGIGSHDGHLQRCDAVLWRPLPYPHRSVMTLANSGHARARMVTVAPADYFDWQR
jgi:hypothetical protein